MQIIFQDPYSSIDPRKTVSQIISEPLLVNKMFSSKAELEKRVAELMEAVGLANDCLTHSRMNLTVVAGNIGVAAHWH